MKHRCSLPRVLALTVALAMLLCCVSVAPITTSAASGGNLVISSMKLSGSGQQIEYTDYDFIVTVTNVGDDPVDLSPAINLLSVYIDGRLAATATSNKTLGGGESQTFDMKSAVMVPAGAHLVKAYIDRAGMLNETVIDDNSSKFIAYAFKGSSAPVIPPTSIGAVTQEPTRAPQSTTKAPATKPATTTAAVTQPATQATTQATTQPAAAPNAPTDLKVIEINKCVVLKWNAPVGGSRPTQYKITRSDGKEFFTSSTEYRDGTAEASKNYTYTVVAVNAAGESSDVIVSVQTPDWDQNYGQPDLVITDMYCTPSEPYSGSGVVFFVTIKNQGTAPTSDVKHGIAFCVNNTSYNSPTTWCDQYLTTLYPGCSVTLSTSAGTTAEIWTAGGQGSYSINAKVDDQNLIGESDENNNEKSINITVREAPPITNNNPAIPSDNLSGGTVEAFGNPAEKTRSSSYFLRVENEEVPVFETAVSNSRWWTEHYLDHTYVAMFDISGTVTVQLAHAGIGTVKVTPQSADIYPAVTTNDEGLTLATFTISKPGQYGIVVNGDEGKPVTLFVNDANAYDAPSSAQRVTDASALRNLQPNGTYVIPANTSIALNNGEQFRIPEGATVYMEGGSIVHGRVKFSGSNSKLLGSGIIDGSRMGDWGQDQGKRWFLVDITDVDHVEMKGIAVLASPCWNIEVFRSHDITLDYVKVVSGSCNSDGLTMQSSQNITMTNSYLRTWDDTVVVKNYSDQAHNSCHITIDSCQLWTDFAQTMEIGYETNKGFNDNEGQGAQVDNYYPEISDVTFQNITVLHAYHKPIISIHNADYANVHDIHYKDIVIENNNIGNGDGYDTMIDFNCSAGSGNWATRPGMNKGTRYNHDIEVDNVWVIAGNYPTRGISDTQDYTITNVYYGANKEQVNW